MVGFKCHTYLQFEGVWRYLCAYFSEIQNNWIMQQQKQNTFNILSFLHLLTQNEDKSKHLLSWWKFYFVYFVLFLNCCFLLQGVIKNFYWSTLNIFPLKYFVCNYATQLHLFCSLCNVTKKQNTQNFGHATLNRCPLHIFDQQVAAVTPLTHLLCNYFQVFPVLCTVSWGRSQATLTTDPSQTVAADSERGASAPCTKASWTTDLWRWKN